MEQKRAIPEINTHFRLKVNRVKTPDKNLNFIRAVVIEKNSLLLYSLTLTRQIGLPPHASVAQKIADQR